MIQRKKPLVIETEPKIDDNKIMCAVGDDAAQEMTKTGRQGIQSDTTGSYTGTSIDGDAPTQDADDL